MPCLFAMFAGLFPRLGTIFIWIARPVFFNTAFKGSWFWPVLGIIFLPFTTLMYVILFPIASGWDWFWLIMAVLIDVGHWTTTAYQNRKYMPGYTNPPQPAA